MGKIIRHEFTGSILGFWLLCLTIVLIPLAVVYLLHGTLQVVHEVDDPEEFVAQYRTRKRVT